jgi:hypothetical protein
MSRWTFRILAPLALLAPLASSAEAGVGNMSGGALSSFGRLSPLQTVQYGGDCWYDDGWSGPGYYPCGNEWNSGLGGAGPVAPSVVPAIRRHHRHGTSVGYSQAPNKVYPGVRASRRLGAGGVPPSVGLRAGGPVSPGVARGGFYGDLGGGAFHHFHSAGIPHISAPASPGFIGGGGHGLGGATGVHIGAPASPTFASGGAFHAGGGIGAQHIGGAASPGFAGGGFHGGGGVFQGGGAGFGQGGIGHR